MAPVLPLFFAKVLACSAPFFFTFGLNLKHCSLSPNFIHKFIKTEFVNVITILSVKMLSVKHIAGESTKLHYIADLDISVFVLSFT